MLSIAKNIITTLATYAGLLSLIPHIRELIVECESSGATGEQKKQAVLNVVTAGIPLLESSFKIDLPDSLIVGFIDKAIDAIVAAENLLGKFKHTDTTTASDAAAA